MPLLCASLESWTADLAPLSPLPNARTQTVTLGQIAGGSFASPAGDRSMAIWTRCPKRRVLVAQADQLARHLLDVA